MNAMAALPADLRREPKDPTSLVWPPTLPIELALKTATPAELQIEYGYTDDQWEALRHNPVFIADLTQACELVRQEGMSFKLKAKMLAEDNLTKVYGMIHASHDAVPPQVKKDLILGVARWAGFDNKLSKDEGGGPVNANMLNVQINLGSGY